MAATLKASLLAFSLLLVAPAAFADPGDGGDAPNDPGGGQPVAPGEFEGDLGVDDDSADWYRIGHDPFGGFVRVSLAVPNGPHIHLVLASPDGGFLAEAHASPHDSASPWVGATLDAGHESGVVQIGVVLLEPPSGFIPYKVDVRVEPGFDCSDFGLGLDLPGDAASALDVEPGGYGGSLGCAGDTADWVRVDHPAGTGVRVGVGSMAGAPLGLRIESDDGSQVQETGLQGDGGGGAGAGLAVSFEGPVRVGFFGDPEWFAEYLNAGGGPFGYGMSIEIVPAPDVSIVRLEVQNGGPILQTDGAQVHSGMDRTVFVEVNAFGESRANDVLVSVSATTVSDGVTRQLGEQYVGIEPWQPTPLKFDWFAGGQLGDVVITAEAAFGPDPYPDNNVAWIEHYSVVGGTGRGYTYAEDFLVFCVGEPEDDGTAACAGAFTDRRSVGAGALASVAGVGAAGGFLFADTAQPAAGTFLCSGESFEEEPAQCAFGFVVLDGTRAAAVAGTDGENGFAGAAVSADAERGEVGVFACTGPELPEGPADCRLVCVHDQEPYVETGPGECGWFPG